MPTPALVVKPHPTTKSRWISFKCWTRPQCFAFLPRFSSHILFGETVHCTPPPFHALLKKNYLVCKSVCPVPKSWQLNGYEQNPFFSSRLEQRNVVLGAKSVCMYVRMYMSASTHTSLSQACKDTRVSVDMSPSWACANSPTIQRPNYVKIPVHYFECFTAEFNRFVRCTWDDRQYPFTLSVSFE